ncbi:isoaspartyl peptidase/L-asparaginase family protein [Methylobacterium haplocladii]|uniref:Isoaspartyl peptidase n=1 Tax=Methylobacterium haplocladii TaxID=1176176 RepID=A0A512IVG5_9HYPH|nr:isoaspartyl peptidase/L-asparaginase [Methylobacterium haplocladii]GEP01700.1 L-asparaginase [Methylobacterium haplocladii]GJD86238.1 Isoaspartyl peptidase [Methylobacterium haplocladii]GLS60282.1 L-asparaginase [Methylobacterium haplocladii]
MSDNQPIALALHGGAIANRRRDYAREIPHMQGLVEAARDRLLAGASALDVAVETIAALEASGLYAAGRGASPNGAGHYELDASLVDGTTGAAGAVAALQGFRSPILAARAVMEATPHVLLAGDGAAAFAHEQGLAAIDDRENWFTHAGLDGGLPPPGELAHGTVGCVVRDAQGRLAGGTSTGGVFGKLHGRVGDTPLVGAGVWADRHVAVSSTGQGEYFIRTAAAAQVAMRMRFGRESLEDATRGALADIAALGGEGGMIAIDAEGHVVMRFNSAGLKRAALHRDGRIEVGAF